jgi:hypothetical protein
MRVFCTVGGRLKLSHAMGQPSLCGRWRVGACCVCYNLLCTCRQRPAEYDTDLHHRPPQSLIAVPRAAGVGVCVKASFFGPPSPDKQTRNDPPGPRHVDRKRPPRHHCVLRLSRCTCSLNASGSSRSIGRDRGKRSVAPARSSVVSPSARRRSSNSTPVGLRWTPVPMSLSILGGWLVGWLRLG